MQRIKGLIAIEIVLATAQVAEQVLDQLTKARQHLGVLAGVQGQEGKP